MTEIPRPYSILVERCDKVRTYDLGDMEEFKGIGKEAAGSLGSVAYVVARKTGEKNILSLDGLCMIPLVVTAGVEEQYVLTDSIKSRLHVPVEYGSEVEAVAMAESARKESVLSELDIKHLHKLFEAHIGARLDDKPVNGIISEKTRCSYVFNSLASGALPSIFVSSCPSDLPEGLRMDFIDYFGKCYKDAFLEQPIFLGKVAEVEKQHIREILTTERNECSSILFFG